jgi:hypothetical protein
MKLTIALITAFALSGSLSYAQSSPGGPGTPRPAATSASSPRDTTGMAPNKSGSGTSTSGGSDANGDQGRDMMPNSNKDVKPLDQQHKPEKEKKPRIFGGAFLYELFLRNVTVGKVV